MIRFQFVYDHRTEYSVKRMCHVLKLNRSSFYKWVNTREKRRLKSCSDVLSAGSWYRGYGSVVLPVSG
ncbi:hypothetical protein ACL1CF_07955 [Corynebacterium striatum]